MEKQAIIKTLQRFSPLSKAAQEDLLALFSYKEVNKGAFFVQEGNYTSELGFVIDGVLRAYYVDQKGTEYNKTFFTKNAFAISLASVLQRIPSYLNFDALVDTALWVADYYQLTQLFAKHRDIETVVRKVIEYKWVVEKELRELRLVLNNAEERYRFFQEEYPGLENLIPQYHIASHLGITPIQLSRIRAKMAGRKRKEG